MACEEIRHRLQMMHGENETDLESMIVRQWQVTERWFAKVGSPLVASKPYEAGAGVFCEHIGFAHLISVAPYERNHKQHKVGIARIGYPPGKSAIPDFEDGTVYVAEMARIAMLERFS